MDLIKIGKFIAERRKSYNLTQMQLAEKLNVTDKAVSKWENGKSMPDSSIMLALCKVLNISVNELLCGEILNSDNYNKTETLLLELSKLDELKNKKIITSMWSLMIPNLIFYLIIIYLSVNITSNISLFILIITVSTTLFITSAFVALKMEVDAGYYKCKNCNHKFIPSYKKALFAMHIGTTRYLKCPKCHKRTWAKKIMNK